MFKSKTVNGWDRRLYLWAMLFVPLIVLIGFARTYYLKPLFETPAIPSRLVHLHGIVMTSWVALFVAQIWLVSSRRTRVHQRLGIAGAVLAGLVVCVGVVTALFAAARGVPPEPPPLQFLVVPLGDMLVFAVLVGTALYYRRRTQVHKRLMLLASLSLLTAAIARFPFKFIETGGPLVFFGLSDLLILGCVAFDTVKNRRLHLAFLWGALFVIAFQPLRIMLAGTDRWNSFATALVNLIK